MKPELEAMIQDYLDDRLDSSERAAFEARLREDSALSRRVEAHAALRQSLREVGEGEIEPSPGFYTRARARFEETQRPRRRFALLSWETAGLAATVAVIAVLFVPALIRRDPAVLAPPTESTSRPLSTAPPSDPSAEPETQPESNLGLSDEGAASSRDLLEGDDSEGSFAPSPPPAADRLETKREVAQKAKKAEVALEELPEKLSREDTPEPAPLTESRNEALGKSRRQSAAGARMADERSAGAEARERVMQDAPATPGRAKSELESGSVPAVPLRTSAVARGQVLVLSDPTEIAELRRDEPEIDRLMTEQPGMRLVLIGPRTRPMSCDRLHWRIEPVDHLIEAGLAGPGTEPAAMGCAILLPRDGRGVKVTEGS